MARRHRRGPPALAVTATLRGSPHSPRPAISHSGGPTHSRRPESLAAARVTSRLAAGILARRSPSHSGAPRPAITRRDPSFTSPSRSPRPASVIRRSPKSLAAARVPVTRRCLPVPSLAEDRRHSPRPEVTRHRDGPGPTSLALPAVTPSPRLVSLAMAWIYQRCQRYTIDIPYLELGQMDLYHR